MKENRGIWTGIVGLMVLAALLVWWLSASRPIDMVTSNSTSQKASSPSSTSTSTRLAEQGVAHGSVGVGDDDVASVISSLPGASRFNEMFRDSGVAKTINPNSESKYTVFVPVNRAFDRLPPDELADLGQDEERLVQYAVISGRALSLTAQSTGQMESLSGDQLNFTYLGSVPMVNSSKILAKYEGKNGVVYLIDSVLLPPQRSSV